MPDACSSITNVSVPVHASLSGTQNLQRSDNWTKCPVCITHRQPPSMSICSDIGSILSVWSVDERFVGYLVRAAEFKYEGLKSFVNKKQNYSRRVKYSPPTNAQKIVSGKQFHFKCCSSLASSNFIFQIAFNQLHANVIIIPLNVLQ